MTARRDGTVSHASRPSAPSRHGTTTLVHAATAVGLVHALDDAVLHRPSGVPWDQHLPGLLVTASLTVCALLLFHLGGGFTRSLIALVIGTLTGVNASLHVMHWVQSGPGGSDLTGVAAAFAAVVLVAASPVLLLRDRPGRRTGVRRRAVRAAGGLAAAAAVQLVVAPVGIGIVQVHQPRAVIGPPPSPDHLAVRFEAADGLELSGWYVPSDNGAAVLLVSSAAGDRLATAEHAAMLARNGYGVLLYDARGSGLSEGSPNGYGWGWTHDVVGAVDFLLARPDVEDGRIGALGLSTGADVLLEAAATDRRIRAVIADGATYRSLSDVPPTDRLDRLFMTPLMTTVQLLSGTEPGPPLAEVVPDIAPTPLLLVASGSIPAEIGINAAYARLASEPVELWRLPDAPHTEGLAHDPVSYERRTLTFLGRSLAPARSTGTTRIGNLVETSSEVAAGAGRPTRSTTRGSTDTPATAGSTPPE